ncbi:MAG: zinc ribbon domain-containing protein [Paludibacteraceae bacterium]|nr:zinc ribbon domain-containing protein [Paludibacteraceae bacterium]
MATFTKHEIISASPSLIPDMAKAIYNDFQSDGFDVNVENLMSGGVDISISKGNIFKAVLGMKTALKVTLKPCENAVLFDANVGIFGQQIIPALITYYFFWPVLITQIWGLVQQSKLDDRALAAAKSVVGSSASTQADANTSFCPACGKPVPQGAHFCPSCGGQI